MHAWCVHKKRPSDQRGLPQMKKLVSRRSQSGADCSTEALAPQQRACACVRACVCVQQPDAAVGPNGVDTLRHVECALRFDEGYRARFLQLLEKISHTSDSLAPRSIDDESRACLLHLLEKISASFHEILRRNTATRSSVGGCLALSSGRGMASS